MKNRIQYPEFRIQNKNLKTFMQVAIASRAFSYFVVTNWPCRLGTKGQSENPSLEAQDVRQDEQRSLNAQAKGRRLKHFACLFEKIFREDRDLMNNSK